MNDLCSDPHILIVIFIKSRLQKRLMRTAKAAL